MAPGQRIVIGADVGELEGADGQELDLLLISRVGLAHVAVGGHAGDSSSMRRCAAACLAAGVRVGAHPSYPDRQGFGRRRLSLDVDEVVASVLAQLERFDELVESLGGVVSTVKPHGQLYHDLSSDEGLADALFEGLASQGAARSLVLAAGSRAAARARSKGLRVLAEGFCDRAYEPQGTLRPREEPGAVLSAPDLAAAQALALAEEGLRVAGTPHVVDALCVHSDSPSAVVILDAVRESLLAAGFELEHVAG